MAIASQAERMQAVIAAVERGVVSWEEAARAVGVPDKTIRNWRRWGEERKSGVYVRFLADLADAEARAVARAEDVLFRGVTETQVRRHRRKDSKGNEVIEEWETPPKARDILAWLQARKSEAWRRTEHLKVDQRVRGDGHGRVITADEYEEVKRRAEGGEPSDAADG